MEKIRKLWEKNWRERLKKALIPPSFGDEALDRLTAIMNVVLLGTFLVLVLGLVTMAPGRPVENPVALLFSAMMAFLALIVRRWLYRGQARQAASIFSLTFWLLVFVSVWLAGDIRISASFFFVAILVPTFLLGVKEGAIALVGSILAVFLVALANDTGLLNALQPSSSVSQAIVFTISAGLMYGLFYAARQGLISSLQRAREERDLLQQLIASLPGLLFLLDVRTGQGLWNQDLAQILPLDSDELRGLLRQVPVGRLRTNEAGALEGDPSFLLQIAGRVLTAEGQEALLEAVRIVLSQGRAETELTVLGADGQRHPYLVILQRLKVGERSFLLADGIDITSRRQAEEHLRRLNLELERRVEQRTAQLQRSNEEMEAFVYSVSHDLRAPLRGIDGYTRLLEADFAAHLPPEGREYLQLIRQANNRMNHLIDDLLVLSRVSRRNLEIASVDLSALAQEVITELRQEEQSRGYRQGELNVILQPGMQTQGDPHLLRVLLVNLLSNALKFTRKTAQAVVEMAQITQEAGESVFLVRDNGAGFDMAYADRLFHPFQRLHTEDDFEGSGIGLATVRRIVERHGGRIWAQASPGQGAVFYFTLGGGETAREIAA